MSSQQKKQINLPTHDDVLRFIGYVTSALPFPICIFSFISLTSQSRALSKLLMMLLAIYHLFKFYLSLNSIGFSSDPAYKRIWLNNDLHVLIFLFSIQIFETRSILFYLVFFIMELGEAVEVIRDQLAHRLEDLKDSVISGCNAILACDYIFRVQALCEIIIVPYMLFSLFINFKSEKIAAIFFYTFGYAAFELLNSKHHEWVWTYCGNILESFSKKNQSAGKIIDPILKFCRQIPDFVREFYPINRVEEFVKKHM